MSTGNLLQKRSFSREDNGNESLATVVSCKKYFAAPSIRSGSPGSVMSIEQLKASLETVIGHVECGIPTKQAVHPGQTVMTLECYEQKAKQMNRDLAFQKQMSEIFLSMGEQPIRKRSVSLPSEFHQDI